MTSSAAMRLGRRDGVARLREAYRRAGDAGDRAEAERLAWEIVAKDPTDRVMWFDLALFAKRRRDWPEAVRLNGRALDETPGVREGDPAGWNLGIAATALGDWAQARRGWRAFGIAVPDGDGPVVMRLGMVPVRLNPGVTDLGAEPLQVDGRVLDPEVVWAERLSPAHARIVSVPLPGSGHRYGDVVLTDGTPRGERYDGRSWVSVFDELALLERSSVPTWTVEVHAPEPADAEELTASADGRGLVAEDWTASVERLCVACSHGRPDGHEHGDRDATWSVRRRFGLAGAAGEVGALLEDWQRAAGRHAGELRGGAD